MLYRDYLKNKYQNTAVKLANAEGVPCVLEYSKGKNMRNYEVYANSVQDGTPTPEAPVEIQSVGDLVTDTENEYYGKYDVPITVTGKNLFKYVTAEYANSTLVEDIFDENGNKIGAVMQGNSSSKEGTASYANGWFRPGNYSVNGNICVKLYSGQTVTVSLDYKILEANENFNGIVGLYLFSYESGKGYTNLIKNITVGKDYRLSQTYTITSERNGHKFYPVITLNSCKVEIKNIQIEINSTDTAYEPYKGSDTTHIYLDEPLRKVGDYADYIDFKNQKVVRQIKEITFENITFNEYSYGTELDNTYHFYIRSMSCILSSSMLCNIIKAGDFNMNNAVDDSFFTSHYSNQGNGGIYLQIEKSLISGYSGESNAEKLKAFLIDKNAKLLYCTTEYSEENISLPALKTFKGTSIMSVDTAVLPSNIKAKYIRT